MVPVLRLLLKKIFRNHFSFERRLSSSKDRYHFAVINEVSSTGKVSWAADVRVCPLFLGRVGKELRRQMFGSCGLKRPATACQSQAFDWPNAASKGGGPNFDSLRIYLVGLTSLACLTKPSSSCFWIRKRYSPGFPVASVSFPVKSTIYFPVISLVR